MTNDIVLEIAERKPFAEGAGFGEAGAYERLKGRAHFAVDPDAPAQAAVTDLQFAPRDENGRVRFAADFFILKPVDPAKGNRRLFFDWGNRGNKRALQFFNDAAAANDPATIDHAGNGFLFRRGYSIAWAGWQGDLYPGDGRMLLDVPIAQRAARPDYRLGPQRVHRGAGGRLDISFERDDLGHALSGHVHRRLARNLHQTPLSG